MARLTAPLMSLTASGTLGKAITFSSWKGIAYARTRIIPANPKSTAQVAVRNIFTNLGEMWKRMPTQAKQPWGTAVLGQPLTQRNKHIQLNVPALQGDANLDDLVMSVASGQAIEMANVAWADGADGTAACTCDAPTAPVGYTLMWTYGLAIEDGNPEELITRTTYWHGNAATPWTVAVDVPTDGDYQCGLIAVWMRDSDEKYFFSVATRDQVAVTGN